MQGPKLVKLYVSYMGGIDHFHQSISYYAIALRMYCWTKKTIFYILQMGLLNSYILYCQYTTERVKVPLRLFQESIADSLLNYNEEEWYDSGYQIPDAPSLPVNEHFNGPPVRDVPPPHHASTLGPSSATPGPSSAMPCPSSATPSTPSDIQAEEESVDNPENPPSADTPVTPVACHPYVQNIVDHPDHLVPLSTHVQEK